MVIGRIGDEKLIQRTADDFAIIKPKYALKAWINPTDNGFSLRNFSFNDGVRNRLKQMNKPFLNLRFLIEPFDSV